MMHTFASISPILPQGTKKKSLSASSVNKTFVQFHWQPGLGDSCTEVPAI
ncbi:hypothetical protein QJS04_geneDACA005519 [Acorus gramineus]|uniref:Uncharacterized protein n=1 Tax=Acorus gramineus TaxID=55184 RepID=A0AAV9A5K5_ACOGR|nr:hypothetical protein QJS04_geneDACA005519 [Acorus gramineus]